MSRKIIVGSRKSKLALTQTNWFIEQLKSLQLPYSFEVREIVTKGDKIVDVTLSKVGGKGLFVKEIEQAMLEHQIDFAVHSIKDMPAELPAGLMIGCIPQRVDARDVLISKEHQQLEELPEGAIIGTSSLRRSAQILQKRPDVQVKWIRGNIDTRIRKLQEEEYDAIILAAAGLERMGWKQEMVTQYLPEEICLPAVGQGALGIQCRTADAEVIQLLQRIHDTASGLAVEAERSFLATIEGGCQVPVAAYATFDQGMLNITGLVASPDGKIILKEELTGQEPKQLGVELANLLIEKGAADILEQVRKELEK